MLTIRKKIILYTTIVILTMVACKSKKKNTNSNSSDIKTEYYKSGEIKYEVSLIEGIEHGNYLEYYKNKKIKKEGVKIKGKKNGLWKYYNPTGDINSAIQYFNDSIIYNLDTNDFRYVLKNVNEILTINIPREWKVINNLGKQAVLLALKKKCDKNISFCPNFTITKQSKIDSNKIDSYLKDNENFLKKSLNNYRLIKQRKYNFNKNIYVEKIYIGTSQGAKIGAITTWIFNDKETYIITGMALNEKENSFLKYEGLFKDITNSIQILIK